MYPLEITKFLIGTDMHTCAECWQVTANVNVKQDYNYRSRKISFCDENW